MAYIFIDNLPFGSFVLKVIITALISALQMCGTFVHVTSIVYNEFIKYCTICFQCLYVQYWHWNFSTFPCDGHFVSSTGASFVPYTLFLRKSHKKKSSNMRSGDRILSFPPVRKVLNKIALLHHDDNVVEFHLVGNKIP